jgi:3',5'-cyclic AMP phosphodiesterase CpdA
MDKLVIAQISDLHCGSPYFVTNLMTRAVDELNELSPDLVVITGDLTDMGYRQEFKVAHTFLSRLECPNVLVVPGNHDARHVGFVHFEDYFGDRGGVLDVGSARIMTIDSSEPDLDGGRVGRDRYRQIAAEFSGYEGCKVLALHHHVLPVPGTGRERNIIYDAGDLLEVLVTEGVDLVLCGHKHVPYVWRLEDLTVVNAGTVSSMKLRGRGKPCYNVMTLERSWITVERAYPFGERECIARFAWRDESRAARMACEIPRAPDGGGKRQVARGAKKAGGRP